MHLTVLERNCHMYATFQSHNQKVVQNRNGIFLSYLTHYDESTERGRWVLAHSADGGATFRTVHAMDIVGAKPPAIETDGDGNLMVAGEDGSVSDRKIYYFRLLAEENYRRPVTNTRLPCGSLSKFAMEYDAVSGTVYLFNHYGGLYVIDALTGNHRQVQVMNFKGAVASTQYPLLYLDRDRVLHHAWTTQHMQKYLYWDIHYARSADRGDTWTRADGSLLETPFAPDHSGPADQIILPDEFEAHTWLSSMMPRNGKVHFAYLAQCPEPRQHYVRLDPATGKIDRNVHPRWEAGGLSINNLDGFFASRRDDPSSPLYYVSRANFRHIAALASSDEGETWRAVDSSGRQEGGIYSVGGCREVTPEGYILGTFTLQEGKRGDACFFSIAAT